MPHAPLLLPEVGGDRGAAIVEAVASIDLSDADAIVLASPHGRATGIYRAPSGNLDAFGPRGSVGAAQPDEELTTALSKAWGRPVLDEAADHGIVVPLRLLAPSAPVVAVTFAEGMGADEVVAEGTALADALSSLERSVAFVASANLSPGLSDRSPLPSLEGAAAADEAVLAALRNDPEGLLGHADAIESAGSCGAPVLAAFGSLFAGATCEVLAYEQPFGVGYAVAVTR